MATKQNSKAKRSTNPKARKPIPTLKATEPTKDQFAAFGRKIWELQSEAKRAEATRLAEQEAEAQERARIEAAGVTIKGAHLEQAKRLLVAIGSRADAARELAVDAICSDDASEASRYLVGIENIALVICRKCDVLAQLMGDKYGTGYGADEFEVVREEALEAQQ